MPETTIDQEAEWLLLAISGRLTGPRASECLACYVARMVTEFGCDDTLRFALHHRDLRAPRATALAERLGRMGGYCDCEIFLNAYQVADHLISHDEHGDPQGPDAPPPCEGVRRGSSQPCGSWRRQRRRW